jgi:hypothetical protein
MDLPNINHLQTDKRRFPLAIVTDSECILCRRCCRRRPFPIPLGRNLPYAVSRPPRRPNIRIVHYVAFHGDDDHEERYHRSHSIIP